MLLAIEIAFLDVFLFNILQNLSEDNSVIDTFEK